jgi:hypothetical protein
MGIAYNPKVVTNGLVFNFDARNIKSYLGTGTACYDLAGQTTVGETVNSPTFNTNGYFSFVTDDYIRFPNSTALDVQTFTIEVWVRTNTTNQAGFWFEKGTVNSQYSLFQEGGGIVCRVNTTASGLINTINPATATYMNTVQVGTGSTTGTVTTSAGGMSIGAYGGYTGSRGYYYNGDQSIAKVYNRVLSQAEVQQNFNATRGRYGI